MTNFGMRLVYVAVIVAAALVAAWIIDIVVLWAGRRVPWLTALSRHTRMPFRALVATVAALIGMHAYAPRVDGTSPSTWSRC